MNFQRTFTQIVMKRFAVFFILFTTACTTALPATLVDEPDEANTEPTITVLPSATQTETIEPPTPTSEPLSSDTPEPFTPTPKPSPELTRTPVVVDWEVPEGTLLSDLEEPPRFAEVEFSTDFRKHSVSYGEILSGGPPKDGIPAVDEPFIIPIEAADLWIRPSEPVLVVQVGDLARAYPIQILMWHEIVNDEIDGVPITVTFCPLCNTGIAFDRRVLGHVFDFGTTGRLRFSNLIMYDRQTESWWQQATGEALAGDLTGYQLTFYPAAMVSWVRFKTTFPNGDVLSRDTGHTRPYGQNPYAGYDDVNSTPWLFFGPETPGTLPPMARVFTLDLENEAAAYPYDALEEVRVVNDSVDGQPVVVFWAPGAASALDQPLIAAGQRVGSAVAFSSVLDDQTLTFVFRDGDFWDEQTDSRWTLLGVADQGPLEGSSLAQLPGINHFWFSWAAFRPETRVFQPQE